MKMIKFLNWALLKCGSEFILARLDDVFDLANRAEAYANHIHSTLEHDQVAFYNPQSQTVEIARKH